MTLWKSLAWLSATEAWDRVRQPRHVALGMLCAALAVVSVSMGRTELEGRRRELARLTAAGQVMSTPTGQTVLRYIREPEPMSVLVRGAESPLPLAWDFSAIGTTPAGSAALARAPWADALDLEFLVRVLLGLLAVLAATDSLTGTRAQDALRGLRSLPIPPHLAVLSQVFGGGLAMLAASTVILAPTLAAVPDLRAEGLFETMFALLAATFLYAMVLYFLTTLITLRAGPQNALASSIIAWALLAVALPPIAGLASYTRDIDPVFTSSAEQQRRFDAGLRDTEREMGVALAAVAGSRRDWSRLLAEPDARAAIEAVWAKRIEARRVAASSTPAHTRIASMRSWLGLLSPATAASSAMTSVSGTSPSLEHTLIDAVRARTAELQTLFDDPPRLTVRLPAAAGGEVLSYTRHPPAHVDAPASPLVSLPARGQRLKEAWLPLLQLLAMNTALTALIVRPYARRQERW